MPMEIFGLIVWYSLFIVSLTHIINEFLVVELHDIGETIK